MTPILPPSTPYILQHSPPLTCPHPHPVLEIAPGDPKALFRRCQAFEATDDLEKAYKDAMLLAKLDPKNTAAMEVIHRLNPTIQKKVRCDLGD